MARAEDRSEHSVARDVRTTPPLAVPILVVVSPIRNDSGSSHRSRCPRISTMQCICPGQSAPNSSLPERKSK
jgi:hypothetical protein